MSERTGFRWGDVLVNALSTFIAATFIGAGVIVWNAASTMDHKIDKAKANINKQQNSITGTQEILKRELSSLKTSVEILGNQIEQIESQLAKANEIIIQLVTDKDLKWQGFTKPVIPSSVESNRLESRNLDRLDKLLDRYKLNDPSE